MPKHVPAEVVVWAQLEKLGLASGPTSQQQVPSPRAVLLGGTAWRRRA
jgi:hypothetical protein